MTQVQKFTFFVAYIGSPSLGGSFGGLSLDLSRRRRLQARLTLISPFV